MSQQTFTEAELEKAADGLTAHGLTNTAAMLTYAATLVRRLEMADDLLRRLQEWDDLPWQADGPYWLREIAKVRALLTPPEAP